MSLISHAISGTVMNRTCKTETEQREYRSLPGGSQGRLPGSSVSMQPGILCKSLPGTQARGGHSRQRDTRFTKSCKHSKAVMSTIKLEVSSKWSKMILQAGGIAVVLIQWQEAKTWIRRQRFCSRLLPITIHLTLTHTRIERPLTCK